jgi:Bacterial Ig-like domain (group 2)
MTRHSSVVALAMCVAGITAWAIACSDSHPPTSPTTTGTSGIPPTLVSLSVTGNTALTAVGETSQLAVIGHYSDATTKDMSPTAHWSVSNITVITVSSTGLVTALDLGRAGVFVSAGGRSVNVPITVLPIGTYIVGGTVTEAGNVGLANARVDLLGGAMDGRSMTADSYGRYAFVGVSGVQQVRAMKDGYYNSVVSVGADTEHVNVNLTPVDPYTSIAGVYRLTFTASNSCQLPADAASRTYTATVQQTNGGAVIHVTLSGAQFVPTSNQFDGHVLGNSVSATLFTDFYYGGGLEEKLGDNRYLSVVGTANGTASGSSIALTLAGSVTVSTSTSASHPLAVCAAADHQLLFSPIAVASTRR